VSLNAQSGAAAHGTGLRPTSMFYQPKARMLVMEFPNRGTYIYQGVTARAYDRLKCSMNTHVRFVEKEDRHFCVVEAR
jgi:hypothetical protein